MFHIGEHDAEREFNLIIKLFHPVSFQLFSEFIREHVEDAAVFFRRTRNFQGKILCGKFFDGIFPRQRIQQIRRKRGIETESRSWQSAIQQTPHHFLDIVRNFCNLLPEKSIQESVPFFLRKRIRAHLENRIGFGDVEGFHAVIGKERGTFGIHPVFQQRIQRTFVRNGDDLRDRKQSQNRFRLLGFPGKSGGFPLQLKSFQRGINFLHILLDGTLPFGRECRKEFFQSFRVMIFMLFVQSLPVDSAE